MLETISTTSAALVLSISTLFTGAHIDNTAEPETRPEFSAEFNLGERLFREPRFSQFYFANSHSNPNKGLEEGDPALDFIEHFDGQRYPSPFAGQSMSCASCHMVDQAQDVTAGQLGIRLYSDFSSFSPVPERADGAIKTLRNSQAVVMPYNKKGPTFFHWDGEFNSLERLVLMGLAGRNMGWRPNERRQAHHHVFNILRGDDGMGELASEFGGLSYQEIFLSEDPTIPEELRLPKSLRIDLSSASPHQAMMRVAFLIAEYMRGSQLQQNADGHYTGSPYDRFLQINNLPKAPLENESDLQYSQRLLQAINSLENPVFVSDKDSRFESHQQEFRFDQSELKGLKLFLTLESDPSKNQKAGACVACHRPPDFTDFGFHNIGVGQLQYERVHGFFSYNSLKVPNLEQRNQDMQKYGTPNFRYPDRRRTLGSKPNASNPEAADLGVWNVFLNPDYPHLQEDLMAALRISLPGADIDSKSDDELLALTAGMSKTPSLRNLGHTAPYFRDGHARGLSQVIGFYIATSRGAKQGIIRNPAPQLLNINIQEADKEPLVRFLKSLNEDYE